MPFLFQKDLVVQTDPVVEEIINTCEKMGWIDFFSNTERLLLNVIRSLNFSEIKGCPAAIAMGSMSLGVMFDLVGMFWLAEKYHHRGLAMAEHSENPLAIGHSYLGLAFHEHYRGHWDSAMISCEKGANIQWEVGHLRGWADPTMLLSMMYLFRGDFDKSRELTQRVYQIGEEGGDSQTIGWGLSGMGHTLLCSGEPEKAEACLTRSIELLKAVPDPFTSVLVYANLGECYLHRGEFEHALTILDKGLQMVSKYKVIGFPVSFLQIAYTKVAVAFAEHARSLEKTGALKKARSACKTALKHSRTYCVVSPQACRLQGTYKWLKGKPSSALTWWERSLKASEELGANYELGMTYLEMGKRLKDINFLENARVIFKKLNVQWISNQIHDYMINLS